LKSRIDDLDALLEHAGVREKVTLVVHDWGGMIGLGWALRYPERVARLVILNTGAFPLPASKKMPWQLSLGRDSKLGALTIRGFNAFSGMASYVGVKRRMPADVRRAYVAPYDSWAHRIATLRFVQDIPLSPGDKAWSIVEEGGRRLHELADRPAILLWGMKDFVFDTHFLQGFRERLPRAQVHEFPEAGHYVLEDEAARIVPLVRISWRGIRSSRASPALPARSTARPARLSILPNAAFVERGSPRSRTRRAQRRPVTRRRRIRWRRPASRACPP
jgi:pimeloyl-ACP methyl ester carboxylesterase